MNLLNDVAGDNDRVVIHQGAHKVGNRTIRPDGIVKEAKDTDDDLDKEIAAKFAKGYPNYNILFEDSENAVLYQNGEVARRASLRDNVALVDILNLFLTYEQPKIEEFGKAVAEFSDTLPDLAGV